MIENEKVWEALLPPSSTSTETCFTHVRYKTGMVPVPMNERLETGGFMKPVEFSVETLARFAPQATVLIKGNLEWVPPNVPRELLDEDQAALLAAHPDWAARKIES